MNWQPIETFPAAGKVEAVLYGRGYGYDDTPEQIAKADPRIWLLSYTYTDEGRRVFASTETYWTDSTWYVEATHWMPLPNPPSAA